MWCGGGVTSIGDVAFEAGCDGVCGGELRDERREHHVPRVPKNLTANCKYDNRALFKNAIATQTFPTTFCIVGIL